jgi:hypothetical protein
LAATGLHSLDDARYLHDAQHADAMLCRLVADHSYAIVEAGERGLANVLGLKFAPASYVHSSALTFCDMTTSPDGELVPVERRLAEIHDRYGRGHLVSRSIQRAAPMILRAVEQGSRPSRPQRMSLQPANVPLCQSRLLSPAPWGFVSCCRVGGYGRMTSKIPHRRSASRIEQSALSRDNGRSNA